MDIANRFIKIMLMVSLVLWGAAVYFDHRLPPADEISPELFSEPVQGEARPEPISIAKGEYRAELTPLYSYELAGLVVSDYDSESWWDFFHKYDPFNTKDICVIWGDNVKSDNFRQVNYSHGEFTCYFNTDSWDVYHAFNFNQLANNHLVPASDSVYRAIKAAKVSDQVRIKGYLVNSEIYGPDGLRSSRHSSTTRDDQGNGACEVVYVTDFKVIRTGNPLWSLVSRAAPRVAIICAFTLILLFWLEARRGWRPRPVSYE